MCAPCTASSCDVEELNDEIIDLTDGRGVADQVAVDVGHYAADGSAVSRVGNVETPFGGRQAAFMYNIGCCHGDDRFAAEQSAVDKILGHVSMQHPKHALIAGLRRPGTSPS